MKSKKVRESGSREVRERIEHIQSAPQLPRSLSPRLPFSLSPRLPHSPIPLLLSLFLLCFGCFSAPNLRAERLPIKIYTSADGMGNSVIYHVYRDSRGFLWFSTRDGLSRFDGREFSNYTLRDDDAVQNVTATYETRDGFFWIAAADGLYRIDKNKTTAVQPDDSAAAPVAGHNLKKLNAEKVLNRAFGVLYEDRAGNFWGGSNGLFLLRNDGENGVSERQIELGAAANSERGLNVSAIAESVDGSLWIGCFAGLLRRLPADGRIIHYAIRRTADADGVLSIAEDVSGRLFVGHGSGLFVLQPEPLSALSDQPDFTSISTDAPTTIIENQTETELPAAPGAMRHFILRQSNKAPSTLTAVSEVFKTSDGKMWTVSGTVLYSFEGGKVTRFDDERGLPSSSLSMEEDLAGNLWLASNSGAIRFTRLGFTTYGRGDGIFPPNVASLHETADGRFFVVHGGWRVSESTADGFKTSQLQMPDDARAIWGSRFAVPGDGGEWWVLASNGLYRFAAPDQTFARKYGKADGLKSDVLFCAWRDSRGNFWFSTRFQKDSNGVTKYDPATGKFYAFGDAENYPAGKSPDTFVEDASGNLWFGFYEGGITRFDGERFAAFTPADGLPEGIIPALYIDAKNRLWIASGNTGLAVVENPRAEKLEFKRLTTADGLASNNIRSLTEDAEGNLYVGSVRGIDRLTPETGQIRHFSTNDGLASDFIFTSLRDRRGNLWFGTPNGVSRLAPAAVKAPPAPTVFINGLQIAGVDYRVSEFGQAAVDEIAVDYTRNNLQINFLSVGGEEIRYQYRLDESGGEWSQPSAGRTVNFANLAPGSYKFLVRAVNSDGAFSPQPAIVVFRISPPFWRAWWFLALIVSVAGGAVFALDRYRVSKTRQVQAALTDLQKSERERREAELALQKSREERLAELERVRARIATDLHDDIGSSLTQIAVLSQAAHSQVTAQNNNLDTPLERISNVSIELVNAMSDIVWAINPRKDNLRDLVQRMRRFAADVFTASGVKFDFDAPTVESQLQLGANIRREVFAIYKEAVNNAVKHSGCTRAEISLRISGDLLHLQISDNGRGFDLESFLHGSQPPQTAGGNGLINIRRRGADLGGKCEIITFPGGGTTVLLEIPLHAERDENLRH